MKTKSIWGKPPGRLYKLISLSEKKFKNGFNACVVGCSDGKFLLPFARKGHNVTGYDLDDVALKGGEKDFPVVPRYIKYKYSEHFESKIYPLERRPVLGVIERLKKEKLSESAKIIRADYYKSNFSKKFDVVVTSCSLHYSINKSISLEKKIKKLMQIVDIGGLLYIEYMMAIQDNDYELYDRNKFLRSKEIKNYFNDAWKILHIKEYQKPSFEGAHVDCVVDHFHRFGYVLAERKK